ncbi:MAG: tRNA (adenosine(37)-N6)-dimethylallyltransferase MiaA [Tenericutes bacterium]|nr:tRNA (adenosine(37)-N6)-dimethylallyltransferase MiaA [Mycoplasmatota bacterium]
MNRIIAIVGPTAVGKTKLAIELAKEFSGEVISCDSMQFYKNLDIGTAKVTKVEMEGVKHHLIDILEVSDSFSVAKYQKIVRDKLEEILAKKRTPILVGGSGLFINSVLYDYQFKGDKRSTKKLSLYEEKSLEELVAILKEKSPMIASNTVLDNKRRVLRALEKTDDDLDLSGTNLYYEDSNIIALEMDRAKLYQRINARVDKMMDTGLLAEAKWLYDQSLDTQATKAIGYKEFFSYFDGLTDLETAVELLKRNSRRYAKRQMTWFKNKMNCHWLSVDPLNYNVTIEEAKKYIKEKD